MEMCDTESKCVCLSWDIDIENECNLRLAPSGKWGNARKKTSCDNSKGKGENRSNWAKWKVEDEF